MPTEWNVNFSGKRITALFAAPAKEAAMFRTETSPFEFLRMSFETFADWRRQKAEQYPQDASRNLAAASMLDRLAATVNGIGADYATAYLELCEDDEDICRMTNMESEMRQAAGFNGSWDNAEAFVKEVIAKMTGGLP
jgi:hypothetical protein